MEFQSRMCGRMGKTQGCGVEKISFQLSEFLGEFFVATLSVNIVPNDGMTNGAQMNPDLVRAARFDLHLQQ